MILEVAFTIPAKNNPNYIMLHFEPIVIDDVTKFLPSRPVLTQWADKYNIVAGSKVEFLDEK
jgi:hypothetical protein